MFTIPELKEEKDSVLLKARELTAYIDSPEFYAQDVTEHERYLVKKQEKFLLEYHAGLISLIELKEYPIK